MELLIGAGIGALLAVVLFFVFKDRLLKQGVEQNEQAVAALETKMNAMMPDMMEKLINIANDKLNSEKKEIKTDLDNKRQQIEMMVNEIQKELKQNQKELVEAEKKRTGSFHALREKLEEQQAVTEKLRATTEGLRNILSDNQMRGQFGEKVAEDLLKMSGFVIGVDYEKQSGAQSRPDFTVKLPDGTLINIDAKFPYSNLQRYSETDDNDQKANYLKLFEKDVREKVKQVTTRDYIDVEKQTVDFVILFIPNEMIFSFIYEKLNDVWNDAMNKKVILAGPFSFTAILRLVRQAYENFRYQNNINKIVGHIKEFVAEYDKFSDSLDTLGKRLESVDREYRNLSNTRSNVLTKKIDQIRLDDANEEQAEMLEGKDEDQPRMLN